MRFRSLLPCLVALPLLASAPVGTLQGRLAAGPPIVCAHRGWLSPTQAENSLHVMQQTETRGPFMLEMDLARTRDGAIVLMHDPTVDRTTTGSGAVSALDARTLDHLWLRTRDGAAVEDAPPRLDAVLRWAAATPDTLLMLDLKQTPPAQAMRAVRAAGLEKQVLLLCFDAETTQAALRSDPAVAISTLVRNEAELDQARHLADGRLLFAYIPRDQPPALFARARAIGVPVVTDLLDRADALASGVSADALRDRPAAIVVSNHPVETAAELSAR